MWQKKTALKKTRTIVFSAMVTILRYLRKGNSIIFFIYMTKRLGSKLEYLKLAKRAALTKTLNVPHPLQSERRT